MKSFWKYNNECQFSPDIMALKHLFFLCVCWVPARGEVGSRGFVEGERTESPLPLGPSQGPTSQGFPLILQGMDWTAHLGAQVRAVAKLLA